MKKVIVIKIGSALLTKSSGTIDHDRISIIAEEIAFLHNQYHIVLVSSGAVSCGKKYIENYKGTLSEKKASAAIGNPILIEQYRNELGKYKLTAAQTLCERNHFSNRKQFLQLKETFQTLWNNNIIPIVNENDVVSNLELKFSDNDELAALLSISFNAQHLLLCTSVGGLLDERKKIIPFIKKIDTSILDLVLPEKSTVGLGGMASKLSITRLATNLGIPVTICGINGKQSLYKALQHEQGTYFYPKTCTLKNRQKWLASGSLTLGKLIVDEGASEALFKRKSLLTLGVIQVEGKFGKGEVVEISNSHNEIIAIAKTKLGASDILENKHSRNQLAAHTDDIVIL